MGMGSVPGGYKTGAAGYDSPTGYGIGTETKLAKQFTLVRSYRNGLGSFNDR